MKALVFPGQGSQFVGMGRELALAFRPAAEVFEEVDDALNQHLSRVMFEGADEELAMTANTQPAIMASSVAVMRVLERECGINIKNFAAYVAGHSLGEYSALTAASSTTLRQAAKLLRIRGNAMQRAVPAGQGAMAALIGANIPEVEAICNKAAEYGVCEISNDNSAGQVVISGSSDAIDRAVELAPEFGVKKAVRLNVSAPFHCELMKPAAEEMRAALEAEVFKSPEVQVIANVTADVVNKPPVIKALLVEQVTKTVRWRESILKMKELGVNEYYEIGSGKVLAGLIKRIDKEAVITNLETPKDIELFVK